MDITITVPLEEKALRKNAAILIGMAEALSAGTLLPDVPALDGTLSVSPPMPPTAAFPPPPAPGAVPPPPTPPAAPTPPAPQAPHVAADPIELDSRGLPWDERIHSGKKNRLAKTNAWKLKRGVQPLTVDEVEAELRLKYPNPAPTLPVTTPPTAPTTPVTPPAPATAPVSPDSDLYLPLMAKCTKRINANELTLEAIVGVCNKHGVNTIPELAGRPDIIPIVDMEIETIWTQNTQG